MTSIKLVDDMYVKDSINIKGNQDTEPYCIQIPTQEKNHDKAQAQTLAPANLIYAGNSSMRALMYSNILRRIMLLTPVRIRIIDKPLYMLDFATATEASPISFVLPSKTLCARVLRVSSG